MSYSLRQRPAHANNYLKGRQGSGINKLVIHHAATTSFDGIARTFENASRQASAHYGVGANKNVDQYVKESDTAFHAGNWPANISSIGIENVNSTGAPSWNIADQTFETLVELCRDVAKRNGLLPLKVGVNLFGHKDFSATACPMDLYPRLHELAARVNKSTGGGSAAPAKKPSTGGKKSISTIVDEVLAGKWGNDPDRTARLKAAGYSAAEVQAEVNRRMGVGSAPAKKPSTGGSIKVGSTVTVRNPVDVNGVRLGVSGQYKVMELRNGRAVIGRGGVVTAAINVANLSLVGGGGSAAPAAKPASTGIRVGDKVVVTNPVDVNGVRLAVSGTYDVIEVSGNRVVIGKGRAVTAAINKANIRRA